MSNPISIERYPAGQGGPPNILLEKVIGGILLPFPAMRCGPVIYECFKKGLGPENRKLYKEELCDGAHMYPSTICKFEQTITHDCGT